VDRHSEDWHASGRRVRGWEASIEASSDSLSDTPYHPDDLQTILLDPSKAVWSDSASNVSRLDPFWSRPGRRRASVS
jgi:hypothetical protein